MWRDSRSGGTSGARQGRDGRLCGESGRPGPRGPETLALLSQRGVDCRSRRVAVAG